MYQAHPITRRAVLHERTVHPAPASWRADLVVFLAGSAVLVCAALLARWV